MATNGKSTYQAEAEMFRELRPALIRAVNSLPEHSPWVTMLTKFERVAASYGPRERPLRVVRD